MKAKRFFFLLTFFPVFFLQAQTTTELESLTERADSLYTIGKVNEALQLSRQMVMLAEKEGDAAILTDCYTSQGVYLRSSGRLEEAVKAYDDALRYASLLHVDSEETRQSITTLYNNLSALYLDMKNPTLAVDYALRAVKLADECEDLQFRSQIYAVCASVFITQKQHDLARNYLLKAIDLARKMNQPDAELNALTYYLLVLQRTGATEQEMKPFARQADQLAMATASLMSRVNYYQVSFYIQQSRKHYKEAIRAAQKMLALEGIGNYPFLQQDLYNNLHLIYKETGDYRQAYEALAEAKLLGDSLFASEKSRQLEELSVKYESKEKELEIKELNLQRVQDQRRILLLIGALVGIFLLLTFISIYLYQSRKLRMERMKRENEKRERQFEQLQRATEQKLTRQYLDKLEAEHTRLAKELHDGICNDLYALEININSKRNNTSVVDDWMQTLRQSRENIRRVSHELLPPTFKEATIEQVLGGYVESVSTSQCVVRLVALPEDCDWSVLPETCALNIYRIIQEAVSNALKHASPSHITVTLAWNLPNLELSVENDGKPALMNEKGIGMQTMKERAEVLKGSLSVETTAEGTVIRVVIPLF